MKVIKKIEEKDSKKRILMPRLSKKRVLIAGDKSVIIYDKNQITERDYKNISTYLSAFKIPYSEIKKCLLNLYSDRPNLYEHYIDYDTTYKKRKEQQIILDRLNEIRDNMEDFHKFGLSIKAKPNRNKEKQHQYKYFFDFLDTNIEIIEDLIYLGVSPKKICIKFFYEFHIIGLTPIIFSHWKEETKYVKRLKFAYTASAEEQMHSAEEFMMEWLNKPGLTMQHVGLVREIGLFRSRMAEYLDRKKFGKKVEVVDERPQTKVLSGKDLHNFLQEINNISENKNTNQEESAEEESEDFTEFEEL